MSDEQSELDAANARERGSGKAPTDDEAFDRVFGALANGTRASVSEEAADDAGCAILARAGIDPALMPCMLRRVAALEGDTKAGRSAFGRAKRLERRAGLPPPDAAARAADGSR